MTFVVVWVFKYQVLAPCIYLNHRCLLKSCNVGLTFGKRTVVSSTMNVNHFTAFRLP